MGGARLYAFSSVSTGNTAGEQQTFALVLLT